MIRVLVADDASDVRLLVRTILQVRSGIEVVGETATTGATLQATKDLMPDVVICDYSFDEPVTGIDIAPEIKAIAPGAKLILFSAYDDLRDRIAATPAIDAFFLKTDIASLGAAVQSLVTENQ